MRYFRYPCSSDRARTAVCSPYGRKKLIQTEITKINIQFRLQIVNIIINYPDAGKQYQSLC